MLVRFTKALTPFKFQQNALFASRVRAMATGTSQDSSKRNEERNELFGVDQGKSKEEEPSTIPEKVGDTLKKVKDMAGAAYEKAKDTASSMMDKAKDSTPNVTEKAKETASSMMDKTKEKEANASEKAKENVSEKMKDASKDTASSMMDKTKEKASTANDKLKETGAPAVDKREFAPKATDKVFGVDENPEKKDQAKKSGDAMRDATLKDTMEASREGQREKERMGELKEGYYSEPIAKDPKGKYA